MNIQTAYTQWSTRYDLDENLTRDLAHVVTRKALIGLRCKSIIEIGCGTGNNTALLAQIGEKVHALDFSEGMLNHAKQKLKLDHVNFSAVDLTQTWPCEDQSADLIVCVLVLEHIRDLGFVYSEAFRSLTLGGRFFICELHPLRQYQGAKARFQSGHETREIDAFVHHTSDFFNAAIRSGFALKSLEEWWDQEDRNEFPRLVSFMFEK